jgi:hypothetical protein
MIAVRCGWTEAERLQERRPETDRAPATGAA